MSTIIEQGVIGIITGICTTAVLFLIKSLWVTKVIPFMEATKYQGVNIAGQWSGFGKNDNPDNGDVFETEFNLFLAQSAHHLTGSFLFKFKNPEKDVNLDFDVSGYMWEGYVTLNFTPKDKRVTSYATTLLKLHDGGHSLVGTWLFRDVAREFVNQVPLTLVRSQGS
ncbi:hypothetical protein [Shewanella sp. GutDb-MelDb]|uniref:hypothetical protein n=1 Tax=Shewanella sp. GutDb-MelDb TaxID=2058316 RepID=UPI000C7C8E36|nr:hypothetical protein [Shewanella sp. GutDb-MelDb]PKG57264.1 hypothetical protein CXF82_10585 [Shewanella sp. GutDb-MelDb]